MKTTFLRILNVTGFILSGLLIYGQTTTIDLTVPIAVDPNVRIGKLDNGLTYYIRYNKKPEKRVELRLAINAGSILESNDQQGLAHFMEHMNFNGTKTFPKNELIDFLQKTGVRFGADINAYTGFDETVYMLQLPTDDTVLVEKGIQVLEDWTHNSLLDDKEIDKERGVITEEWRLGLGAEDRMMKKYLPVMLKNSRYAERIPIGKIDIIGNFRHEVLKEFYHDWYRPDLAAVIVVGDIDPVLMEAKIKKHFSYITGPASPKERTVYDIPDNKDPLIAIETDKEATNNSIQFFYKHPLKPETNLGDFRENIMAELYTSMLNNRFNEISQKPESPFVYSYSYYGEFLARTKESFIIGSMPKENQIEKSLQVMLAENERVKRFGFTATEFERQKEELLSNYEKAAKEFDKTESMRFSDEYVQNFLTREPIPGAQKAFKYVKNLLPGITLDEVNALAKKWVTDENMAMVITAPDKPGLTVPSEATVLDIIKNSKSGDLKAYVDNYREEPLVSDIPSKGRLVMRKENTELGYTELTLSDSVKVILKPTTFKNDEIVLSAYSLGGHSLYPDNEFIQANYAAQVIDMSGVGNFDNIELDKKLKGKKLEIHPYIDGERQGFRGNSAPKDFETLLQLIYLYFKGPRKDTTAFKTFISQMENQMKFMKSNPFMSFYDTAFKIVYPGYKRMIIFPSHEQLSQVNLEKLFKIYTDRFADASGFKFVFTGSFNVDSITPVIVKYLGNLPSLNRQEKFLDTSPKFAQGVNNLTFKKGTDPQSMVGIVMSDGYEWNPKNNLSIAMLREILNIKLVEIIREQMSGVYSPMINISYKQYPKSVYTVMIIFGCSPKNTGKLSKAVFNEMKSLRKVGPTEIDLNKAKEALIRQRETDLEKNDFWMNKLESIYFNHDDPANIMNFKDRVNAITVEDLKIASNMCFPPDHYVRVVLMPEKK